MEATLNNLYLTEHGYFRGKKRNIYPSWLHRSTAELFVLQKINRTESKEIIKYSDNLMKIVLPDLKAYIRDGFAIVTLVKRRKVG